MKPKELLAELVGEEGPPATLFCEMAAKYGLPLTDGKVPLSTELYVRLDDWRIHLLDVTKSGFPGAIGFRGNNHLKLTFFGFWSRAPHGSDERGSFNVSDDRPLIEVVSGAYGHPTVLGTRISLDAQHYQCRAPYTYNANSYPQGWIRRSPEYDKKMWSVVCEIIMRGIELGGKYEPLECNFKDLLD